MANQHLNGCLTDRKQQHPGSLPVSHTPAHACLPACLPACMPACRRDHQELKVVACGSLNRKEGEGWWNLPSSLYRPSPERLSDLPRSHSKFMESLVSLTGGNPRFTPFHQLCTPGTGRNWWNTGRAVTAFPLKGRGPLSPADKIRDSGSSCRGSVG